MAKIVVMGAGVSGHTAASFLAKWLGKSHEVVVVTPNSRWNWVPSNIWVGIGKMEKSDVTFELAPVYEKLGVKYVQAKAVAIHPEGDATSDRPFIDVEHTSDARAGEAELIDYDFLINATGPRLNFSATEGLGPDNGFTYSVCTAQHATDTAKRLDELIDEARQGAERTLVIGTGHGTCTCQGAAFEYIFNVDYKLRKEGVRDKITLVWLSNEYELGDFGMGGMHLKRGGYITNSKIFTESIMAEREIKWIIRSHVERIEEDTIYIEKLDGSKTTLQYDMAMLLPPFSGVGLKAFNRAGEDITPKLFAPNGFMKVDADYSGKPYDEWVADDWAKTYQNPEYKNVFAVGIAFAPPHLISKPMSSPNGTAINPAPPRTGMPSGMIGKLVAKNIKHMIETGTLESKHKLSMAEMGAACVASTGSGLFDGTAASMTVFPIVPDYQKYPKYGRDLRYTFGEIGLAGHWIKHILHHMFIYKAQCKPGWTTIPE